jgi:hypothetical protein
MPQRKFQWFHFEVLTGLGVLGVIAVFPFVLAVFGEKLSKLPVSLPVFIAIQVAQGAVVIAGATALGLVLARKNGLSLPLLDALEAGQGARAVFKRIAPISLICGGIAGVVIVLSLQAFKPFIPDSLGQSHLNIAPWKGLLASLYGGVNEEILMRLFLMSLIAWLLGLKWRTPDGLPTKSVLLAAILITALLFGAGHLPAMASVRTLTPAIIVMVLALNGLGGVIFGYLYASCGLEAAMIAHFFGDVIIHYIGPILS